MMLASARDLLVDRLRQQDNQLFGLQPVIEKHLRAIDQFALHRHQANSDLGAADVHRDNDFATHSSRFGRCVAGRQVNGVSVDLVS